MDLDKDRSLHDRFLRLQMIIGEDDKDPLHYRMESRGDNINPR